MLRPTDQDGKSKTASAVDQAHYPEQDEVDVDAFDVDEQEIAQRAHELWIERGRRHGSQEQDWFDAEREVRARKISASTHQPEASGTVQHELPGSIRR